MKHTFPLLYTLLYISVLISCTTKEQQAQNDTATAQAFTAIDPSVKTQVAGFLTDYFALNQTLIEDNLDAAKVSATTFATTANSFDISKMSPEQLDFYLVHSSKLKTALEEMSKSSDIEQARVQLATVSESMYAMVKAFHPNDTPLYYQYCPMARDNKGANWISTTKELVNPYMGQMMLACGRTQETIN